MVRDPLVIRDIRKFDKNAYQFPKVVQIQQQKNSSILSPKSGVQKLGIIVGNNKNRSNRESLVTNNREFFNKSLDLGDIDIDFQRGLKTPS